MLPLTNSAIRGNELSQKSESLDLRFLRTCRQVYNEAHHIQNKTNKFSFQQPEVLRGFVQHLRRIRENDYLAIRKMQLDSIIHETQGLKCWSNAIKYCIQWLPHLRHVNVDLDWCCDEWIPKPWHPFPDDDWNCKDLCLRAQGVETKNGYACDLWLLHLARLASTVD